MAACCDDANAAKHAHAMAPLAIRDDRIGGADHATVRLRRQQDRLCAEITDDGGGGADSRGGSGLSGIRRRVEAHDGTFELSSPVGGPTVLRVSVPCGS